MECLECRLVFLDPIPTAAEISRYYEKEFFIDAETGYRDYEYEQTWRRLNYRRDAARIEELVPGGRILDVGCATGTFLKECSERWEKHGLEVSEYAGMEARKVFGDRIHIGPLQDGTYEDGSFDAVTLWETVNHMLDPFGDLRRIHRALRSGGILSISVGDVGSCLARIMGRYWYHVTPPIHLYYFRAETFRHLFRRIGFEVETIDYLGKHVDLATCFERVKDAVGDGVAGSCLTKLAGMRIGGAMLHLNLCDTMYLFARKSAH